MKSYVDLWRWYDEGIRDAYRNQDFRRMQFARLHERMWEIKEKSPQRALELCRQAVKLAQQLNEPCWELFHAYWASEMQIYYVGDIDGGLDYATRNVARAHKPAYADCPIRARVYITLIGVYTRMDPVGYVKEIDEMVAFIEDEIPLDEDTHQRLQYYRAWMHVEFERYPEAIDELMKYMAMCPYSSFRQQSGYGLMTHIEIDQQNYQDALGYAAQYEDHSRRAAFETGTVMGLLWRAALSRKLGSEAEAQTLFRQGMALGSTIEIEGNAGYYNALSSYYEAGGEFEQAVLWRDKLLAYFGGTARQALICEGHLQRCRLLQRAGKLADTDVAKMREAAAKLKDPSLALANLEKVLRGETIRGAF